MNTSNTQNAGALMASPASPAAAISPLAMMQQAGGNALAAVTSNEKVVETLASIFIAKNFPRDLAEVTANMNAACRRVSLASKAVYTYPRGGSSVEGPSVHLADALLGAWGNAESGWREISRSRDNKKGCMVSECVAYCFDKQTNNKHEISFSVPHWRDTKKGGYPLTDERDIYELCANMAARRRRAAILRVLPAWLVEEALATTNDTLRNADGNVPVADLLRRMEAKFSTFGVTKEMLEQKLGHNLQATTRAELVTLGKHYNALEGGHARVDEIFEPVAKAAPMTAAKPAVAPAASTPEPMPEYPEEEAMMAEPETEPADIFAGDNLPGLGESNGEVLDKLSKKLAKGKRRMGDVIMYCRHNNVRCPEMGAPRAELEKFAGWLMTQPDLLTAIENELNIELR